VTTINHEFSSGVVVLKTFRHVDAGSVKTFKDSGLSLFEGNSAAIV